MRTHSSLAKRGDRPQVAALNCRAKPLHPTASRPSNSYQVAVAVINAGPICGSKAVEHGPDAIEELVASFDGMRFDVVPRHRHAKARASLARRSRGGREARVPMAAVAVVALGDVQRDRAQRRAQLLAEIAIVTPKWPRAA